MATQPLPRRPLQPNNALLNGATPTRPTFPPHAPAKLPTKPPATLPASTPRDEALRSLLLQHREQRALIQSSLSPNDLASKLSAALEQISRLDRDFQTFRARAARQLADAQEENRLLRAKLTAIDTNSKKNVRYENEAVKPFERMLSVDEIRGAKKKVDAKQHGHRGVRSLRPLRAGVDPSRRAPDRADGGQRRRMSLRYGKESDVGARVDRKLDADEQEDVVRDRARRGSRRASLLPRSISGKWSACF